MTHTHILKWVKSGTLDDTLGVVSDSHQTSRLSIARTWCALRMDTIYLERFDQTHSCYRGARRTGVGPSGARSHSMRTGRRSLDFREHLHFVLPLGLHDWKAASKIFHK
jgi:hypothetical protein